MNKKYIFNTLSIVSFIFLLSVTACNRDKGIVAKPTITGLEVGIGNKKTGYPGNGNTLHLAAKVVAMGTISNIKVDIKPQKSTNWSLSQTFTEGYSGAKNAQFHQDISIPADAAPGDYYLYITVTDKVGNVARAESDLKIVVDPTLATITGYKLTYDNTKSEIRVEGDISSPNKIAGISLELHNSKFEKEYAITGDYVDKTSFHLNHIIAVSDVPAGQYHVHLVVKDKAGKEVEFENHFTK